MGTYRDNRTSRGRAGERAGSAAATGDLSAAASRLRAGGSRRAGAAGRGAVSAKRGAGAKSSAKRSSFMRYAADNRVVQFIYSLTTGSTKPIFYAAVAAVVLVSIYFPVRDLYAAYRTGMVLDQQLEIRNEYNERLESHVNGLLSTEGIERAAREDLGLVMPGERVIDVVGLEDDAAADAAEGSAGTSDAPAEDAAAGDDAADTDADAEGQAAQDADAAEDAAATEEPAEDSEDEPMTSADVEAAEQAVVEDAPWYIRMLDALFFYQGAEGQSVASTGE